MAVMPIKIAIIGAGFMGSVYARICSQINGTEVVAVCDVVPEQARRLANELGAACYETDDYQRIFNEQDADAALVCTREDAHVRPALAVLAAGKHVLIEKPLATNTADAKTIEAAASANSGTVAMMAHSLRFDPRYTACRDVVASGRIGDVIHISARRTPPFSAFQRVEGRVELPFWVGVHDIDMMHWILQSDVNRVMALASDRGLEGHDRRRAIAALLTFSNGAIAILENSWGHECTSGGQQSTASFRVCGTKGEIEVKNYEQGITMHCQDSLPTPDTVYMPRVHGHIRGVYLTQIEHFIECIRNARSPEVGLDAGCKSVSVAEAILQSARMGAAIDLKRT